MYSSPLLSDSLLEVPKLQSARWADFRALQTFAWDSSTPLSELSCPVFGAVVYLCTVFFLSRFMKNRAAFSLRSITAVHNLFLSVLSFAMAVGISVQVLYEFRSVLSPLFGPGNSFLFFSPRWLSFLVRPSSTLGLLNSTEDAGSGGIWDSLLTVFCDPQSKLTTGPLMYWSYLFYVSKYYEFIDTFLMCLRKNELGFLHVFHHATVPLLFWVYMTDRQTAHWPLVLLNAGMAHVPMYYYYYLTSRYQGIKVPWKHWITRLQIVQFVLDLTVSWSFVVYEHIIGIDCAGGATGFVLGQCIGVAFLYLFIDFYMRSYTAKGKASRPSTTKKNPPRPPPPPAAAAAAAANSKQD
eukprot:ANDGO_06780.mRNA.1 Elongation of fatty acids protein 1